MRTNFRLVRDILLLIFFYFLYQLGFTVIGMAVSYFIVPMDNAMITSLAMVSSTLAMIWHLIHSGHVRIAYDTSKQVSLSVLGVSAIFVFSAMYVLNMLIEQADIPNTMEDTFMAMSHNFFGIISMALLAPVLEELLFRGAIQGMLQETLKNPWKSIIISSLIFGIVHMNPAQIPFAFLLGMIFGWLRYRSGSLLPGIMGHVLNNTIATANMLFYGNATIEEQMGNRTEMWLWATVAVAMFFLAVRWLDRHLERPE